MDYIFLLLLEICAHLAIRTPEPKVRKGEPEPWSHALVQAKKLATNIILVRQG